jgi:hypothetical protein
LKAGRRKVEENKVEKVSSLEVEELKSPRKNHGCFPGSPIGARRSD